MKNVEPQISPMHQILQEALNHPELEPHFGHLRNHFMPAMPMVEEEPVKETKEPKETTKEPITNETVGDSDALEAPARDEPEMSVNVAPEAPHFTINLPEPKVTVNVAPAPTPEINVHVDAPEKLEIPEQKTPEINIELPANENPKSIETIHDNFGNLSQIIKTYADGEVVSTKEGNKWTIDDRRRETR